MSEKKDKKDMTESPWDLHVRACAQYALEHFKKRLGSLSPIEEALWNILVRGKPGIGRLIFYAYSPPEEWEVRCELIWTDIEGTGKSVFDWDLAVIGDLILRVRKHPDLHRLLVELAEEAKKALWADFRKAAGAKDSIEDLRANTFRFEVQDDPEGKVVKIFFDPTPVWMARIEHIKRRFPDGTEEHEGHIYRLDDSPIEDILDLAQKTPVLLAQRFGVKEGLGQRAFLTRTKIYIYDKDGKLSTLPHGLRNNPFIYGPKPAYEPLRKALSWSWKEKEVEDLERRTPGISFEDKKREIEHFKTLWSWIEDRIFEDSVLKLEADGPKSIPSQLRWIMKYKSRDIQEGYPIGGKTKKRLGHLDPLDRGTISWDTDIDGQQKEIIASDEQGSVDSGVEDQLLDETDHLKIDATIQKYRDGLDPTDKEIFDNFYRDEREKPLTSEKLSHKLNKPPSTIRSRKNRIIRDLQKLIAPYFPSSK